MTEPHRVGDATVLIGADCVGLQLDGRHPGATVLTPDRADELADLLRRQARHARDLTAPRCKCPTTNPEEPTP